MPIREEVNSSMRKRPWRGMMDAGQFRTWAGYLAVAALALAAVPGATAQSLLRSSSGGPPTIVGSDLAVLEAGDTREDLPCSLTPAKPALGFDLRYHAGYEITVPMRELAGGESFLTILFRVTPADSPNSPVYFSQRIRVPLIEEDAKGDAFLQGVFDVGEGKYKVDWLMRDRTERVCAHFWETEASLPSRDKELTLTLGPGVIAATEPEQFSDEPPVQRGGADAAVNVKVLVNFAPQNKNAAALQPYDTTALVTILRQFQREPRIHRFSVVAFNLQEERVLFRQDSTEHINFPAIGKALDTVQLGRVDFAKLQQKNSEAEFLGKLIQDEMTGVEPPDALVFAGPKALVDSSVPAESLKTVGVPDFPVFYMNYNLFPQVTPWRDAISHAVRFFKGQEYTISRPRDLWHAVTEIVSKIVKSKSDRAGGPAPALQPGSVK